MIVSQLCQYATWSPSSWWHAATDGDDDYDDDIIEIKTIKTITPIQNVEMKQNEE